MKLKYLISNEKIKNINVNILGLSEDSREIKKNYIQYAKKPAAQIYLNAGVKNMQLL